eukprot:SAG22_NODE_2948_length_2083_cov_17.390121_1_plen_61_part_00
MQCTRSAAANATWSLGEWQALPAANDGAGPKARRDAGSTVAVRPSTATVIGWGDALLRLE